MNANSQMNLTIGVIVALAVAATGTYFAVDYLSGADKNQAAAPADPAAETTDTAAAEAAPADPGSDSNAAIEAATDAAVAAVGDGASLSADEARRIGEEVARQVAAQVAQQIVDRSAGSSGDGSGGLTAEEARRIGEEEGRRVAQEVAQAALANLPSGGGSGGGMTAAEAEQIGLAAGRRAARQVAADTAREVVQNEFGGQVAAAGGGSGSSAAAASDGSAEAAAGSGNGSSEVASSGGGSASSASVAAAQAQPKADALKPWWPGSSGGFGLVYAGQPKGEQAIALLFSGTPSADALNQSVKVYDAKGQAVSGSWETAANPRLAILRGLAPGRYTVVLDGALADSQGQALGKPLHGPVYVI